MKNQTTETKFRKLLEKIDSSNRAHPVSWCCFNSYSYFPELFRLGFFQCSAYLEKNHHNYLLWSKISYLNKSPLFKIPTNGYMSDCFFNLQIVKFMLECYVSHTEILLVYNKEIKKNTLLLSFLTL